MDRDELNRMFDALSPAPGREGELLDGLLQEAGRRKKTMKNWKRAAVGLAAAVLLVGTAAAAHYAGVKIEEGDAGALLFSGGMTYYAADQLSDEIKAFESEYIGEDAPMKTFVSWEEMEDFVGIDLMNSPLLDESPATHFHKEIDNGNNQVAGRFILTVYRGLTYCRADGCYEIGDCSIVVEAHLFTDKHGKASGLDHRFFGIGRFPEGTDVSWEPCVTPGGRQVQIIEIDRQSSGECVGAISLTGIPMIVKVDSREGVAQARDVLIQVLDSFR